MSADERGAELERLRAEIDDVDRSIVESFTRRVAIARRIGELKEAAGQLGGPVSVRRFVRMQLGE